MPRGTSTRRQMAAGVSAGSGAVALALVGCGTPAPPAATREGLAGTFEMVGTDASVQLLTMEKAMAAFMEQHPQSKVTYVPTPANEVAPKIRTTIAAGSGPEGFYHQSVWWRGVDAATVTLPLTPNVFKRAELEQMTYGNLLNSLWSKSGEVHAVPWGFGIDGAMLMYNVPHLANANVDVRTLTSMDAILAAAARLVLRDGGEMKRAGMLLGQPAIAIPNWIMDQGETFYDEKNKKWTWQTAAAEKAFQWVLDVYDKHGVAWRQNPAGVTNAMGEGPAALAAAQGAYAISTYANSHPNTGLADVPMPAFVAGKQPKYYVASVPGYSLSALLKPDDVKAKIGAALFRHLYTPASAITFANEYSGAIAIKGLYGDQKFRETRYGAVRATLDRDVIARTVMLSPAADPGLGADLNKVIAGQLSVKAALSEMQQKYNTAEEEAQRNRR